MASPEDLAQLIDLIGNKLAGVTTGWKDTEWAAHNANLRSLELELTEQAGARFGFSNGASTLRLAGVSASCTSGLEGLLRNWAAAARRKIKKITVAEGGARHGL